MIILLDTSSSTCRVTLVAEDDERFETEWEASRTLADNLIRYLRELLAMHSETIHDVTAIGVMKGPGSFTGLRIGLTVMNTIAQDLRIPIVGCTGDDWQDVALTRLDKGEDDRLVMPLYGREANITRPRK